MSRNPLQAENDWHGLYPMNASMDPVLFPRVRRKAERWTAVNASDDPVILQCAGRQQTVKPGTQVLTISREAAEEFLAYIATSDLPVTFTRQQDDLLEMDGNGAVDSVSHPAKMSLPLLRKILATMQEFGWLRPGMCVVDPFGGRMSTGLVWCAMDPANRSVCIELEPHFVTIGKANLAHAERMLGRKLNLTIIGGDSRKADELLEAAGVGVTSPPYGDSQGHPSLGSVNKDAWGHSGNDITKRRGLTGDYGHTLGQIGNLPDGEEYAAVTSQPFEAQSGGHKEYEEGSLNGGVHARHAASRIGAEAGYSVGAGSPPFEGVLCSQDADFVTPGEMGCHSQDRRTPITYGTSDAQIGATQGETYADACLSVYSALARSGVRYLALVTKNPTRAGKLRRLDKLTCRLLRQAGYRVVAWRRAWLYLTQAEVDALSGQQGLALGVDKSKKLTGRMSFFRRLHLKRGGLAAAWEDVFFCELIQ